MAKPTKLIWQVVRPGQKPVSESIAASVGIAGDLANMVTETVQAWMLAGFFGIGTAVAVYVCLKELRAAGAGAGVVPQEKLSCLPCDVSHFMALSTGVFLLLWAIGGGGSGIEAIGQRLGVIEQKIDVMGEDVGEIRDASQMNIPIRRPKGPADHFHNAFLFHQFRGESTKAWTEAQAIYAGKAPVKLDAAQLFYDIGSAAEGQTSAVSHLLETAERSGDPSLLIVAARAETDEDRKAALYARLQAEHPDYPFSWWDPMRIQMPSATGFTKADVKQRADEIDRNIANLSRFRQLYGEKPASHWFFRPSFQGNLMDMAGAAENSLRQTRKTYTDILSGDMQRRVQADARRQFEDAQAAQRR